MKNLYFTKEHLALRAMVKKFTEKEVKPRAAEADRSHKLDPSLFQMAAELGLPGTLHSEEWGGSGLGQLGFITVLEELARGCASFAVTMAVHMGIGVFGLQMAGTPEQKEKYYRPCVLGEKISACALTEPDAGSDLSVMKTRAVQDGDYYVLNGTKRFITNGSFADFITVFAVTDPTVDARNGITAFVVEKGMPGFQVAKIEDKMGIRASETAELVFEDVRVPKENMLGRKGEGFKLAMQVLETGGRVSLAAMCLGAAKELVDMSVKYAGERVQFGQKINRFQGIQFMLSEMTSLTYAMESMVYRTAWIMDQGMSVEREAPVCKLFSSEAINKIADMAMQIHGGVGFTTEFPVERFYRDARINPIYEGTSEIQKIVIARNLIANGRY
ncbi:acyl-CoA dehydrogenase AcdA [Paradesulfitobacterium aromaticivorans]